VTAAPGQGHDIADPALAALGRQRVAWADAHMPVLAGIRSRFLKETPLRGLRVAACLHITTETANLLRTLRDGGAEVFACASNPLSTQDDVAATLALDEEIPTFAVRGEDRDTYYRHLHAVLDAGPGFTMDDGCDLVSTLHQERPAQLAELVAGTEETTTGVIRLRAMEASGALRYPVVAVNDADTKHLFDNRYGTGQSTIDGIVRATNILLAGKVFVVAGYGHCGKGLAARAQGMGAQVVVTEVDPIRALEATMDGYRVMPMADAARIGDIFVTVTGDRDILTGAHFPAMKDGAVLANSGHFDLEIDLPALAALAVGRAPARPDVEEFRLADGRRLLVVAGGRLVNLGAAEGHPAAVMDMSFANQALCLEWAARQAGALRPRVYGVPRAIDQEIARLKLDSMGVVIDRLTPAQQEYLSSWTLGT
jgi:adenosylhomocysteinase